MTLIATPAATDADSYFTIAEADAYFAARGVATWWGSNDAKEVAARRGTAYVDNAYRAKWIGLRYSEFQALAWPRVDVVDDDGYTIGATVIPPRVKQAAMEAALLALGGATLEPTLERGGQIKSISKSVGPLSKSVTYEDGAPAIDRYLVIERLLRGLVRANPGSGSGNVRLVRS